MTRHRVDELDRESGVKIRHRRVMLGLSQQQLANLIGVTYQQTHKYEKGINRVTVGTLMRIAHALGVPAQELLPSGTAIPKPPQGHRDIIELVRTYQQIASPAHRDAVRYLARTLAETEVVELPRKGAA